MLGIPPPTLLMNRQTETQTLNDCAKLQSYLPILCRQQENPVAFLHRRPALSNTAAVGHWRIPSTRSVIRAAVDLNF